MVCNFYDKTLTKIGNLTSFISLTWSEQYSDVGSFMISVYKNETTISLVKEGFFVSVTPYETLMFIYSVEEKNGQLWAYGAEAKYLLKRRIFDGKLDCKNVEETLKAAINAERPFSIIESAEMKGLSATLKSQRSYEPLFDLAKAWSDPVGYGFKLIFDRTEKKLLFDVYEGKKRDNVVFAEKYKNMTSLRRTVSKKQWANVACVAGGGEGESRVVVWCGNIDSEGFERSEIFVDARDLQQDEGETLEEYSEKLKARGIEKLENYNEISEINFSINSSEFGKEFFLGDIVTCLLPEYGLKAEIRINGFTTIYENNKTTTTLQLGNPILRSVT